MFTPRGISILLIVLFSLTIHVRAAEITGPEIMRRVYEANQVDDQIATLTFQFIEDGQAEKKVVYTMVWKNTKGEDGYDDKAMFFTEFPPDRKGIAYLGLLRKSGAAQQDDEWIYLPELRMVRRIAQRGPHHTHDDDEFGRSLLERDHLQPRSPELDEHKLLATEVRQGINCYVVESRPKQKDFAYPYSKIISWIEQDSLRSQEVYYYDMDGNPGLDVTFEWAQLDGKWIWKRVTAFEPNVNATTILEISNAKINSGLADKLFSSRALMRGFVRP